MTSPRLLALVLALPVALAWAGNSARVAELRDALATEEPEVLKATAIELVSRNEQDPALLDVVADRIAEGQGTQDAALSDALAWLCRPFANARAGRYKQFLDKVSDTAATLRLRSYAALVSVNLPDSSGPPYRPPSPAAAKPAASAPPVVPAPGDPPKATPPPVEPPKPAPATHKAEPKGEPKSEAKPMPLPLVPMTVPSVLAAPTPNPKPKVAPSPAPTPKPAEPPTPKAARPAPAPAVATAPPAPAPAVAPMAASAPVTAAVGNTYRLKPGAQLRTRPLGSGLTLDVNPGTVKLVSSSRNAEGIWWFAKGERASGWIREGDLTAP